MMFYPLVIGTIIAVIIEQIFRSAGDESSWEDRNRVTISTMIRKFLYRWAWNVNIVWFFWDTLLLQSCSEHHNHKCQT